MGEKKEKVSYFVKTVRYKCAFPTCTQKKDYSATTLEEHLVQHFFEVEPKYKAVLNIYKCKCGRSFINQYHFTHHLFSNQNNRGHEPIPIPIDWRRKEFMDAQCYFYTKFAVLYTESIPYPKKIDVSPSYPKPINEGQKDENFTYSRNIYDYPSYSRGDRTPGSFSRCNTPGRSRPGTPYRSRSISKSPARTPQHSRRGVTPEPAEPAMSSSRNCFRPNDPVRQRERSHQERAADPDMSSSRNYSRPNDPIHQREPNQQEKAFSFSDLFDDDGDDTRSQPAKRYESSDSTVAEQSSSEINYSKEKQKYQNSQKVSTEELYSEIACSNDPTMPDSISTGPQISNSELSQLLGITSISSAAPSFSLSKLSDKTRKSSNYSSAVQNEEPINGSNKSSEDDDQATEYDDSMYSRRNSRSSFRPLKHRDNSRSYPSVVLSTQDMDRLASFQPKRHRPDKPQMVEHAPFMEDVPDQGFRSRSRSRSKSRTRSSATEPKERPGRPSRPSPARSRSRSRSRSQSRTRNASKSPVRLIKEEIMDSDYFPPKERPSRERRGRDESRRSRR